MEIERCVIRIDVTMRWAFLCHTCGVWTTIYMCYMMLGWYSFTLLGCWQWHWRKSSFMALLTPRPKTHKHAWLITCQHHILYCVCVCESVRWMWFGAVLVQTKPIVFLCEYVSDMCLTRGGAWLVPLGACRANDTLFYSSRLIARGMCVYYLYPNGGLTFAV